MVPLAWLALQGGDLIQLRGRRATSSQAPDSSVDEVRGLYSALVRGVMILDSDLRNG